MPIVSTLLPDIKKTWLWSMVHKTFWDASWCKKFESCRHWVVDHDAWGRSRERFPHVVVNHLLVSYSNHDPIFLIINGNADNTRRKNIQKRFEEKWATHLECEAIIREVWSREPPMGSPMFQLFSKIRDCRMALVAWSLNIGSTGTRIEEKKQRLQTLTTQNDPANLEFI